MSIDAQWQIRQNATEVQDYMKDLLDWEKDMKRKEKKAQGANNTASSSSEPAVRGRAAYDVQPAPVDLQQPALKPGSTKSAAPSPQANGASVKAAKDAAAHTHSNYKKWEKFDVDAALASDDSGDESSKQPAKRQTGVQTSNGHTPRQPTGAQTSSTGDAVPAVHTKPQVDSGDLVERSTVRTAPSTSKASPAEPALPPPRKSAQEPQVGEYTSAKECYTRSIVLMPTAVGYANRAMASLKLKEFHAAEDDCTQALSLDPNYVKAYHRRATAGRHLGKLAQACRDFEAAIRHEPTHKELQTERDACLEALLSEEKLKLPRNWQRIPITHTAPAPVATTAPASAKTSAPTGSTPSPQPPPATTAPAAATTPAPSNSSALTQPAAPVPQAAPSAASKPPAAADPLLAQHTSRLSTAAAAAHDTSGPASTSPRAAAAPARDAAGRPSAPPRAAAPPPGASELPSVSPRAAATPDATVPPSTSPRAAAADSAAAAALASKRQRVAAAADAAAEQLGSRGAAGIAVPRTSTEFEASWRGFKGDLRLQVAFVRVVRPADLPQIFKTSLSPQVLLSLVHTVLVGLSSWGAPEAPASQDISQPPEALDPTTALELLEQLSKVPRFDMNAMCITSKDKAALGGLWETCASVSGVDAGRLQVLRKQYRM